MRTSETIGKIAAALVKAQKKMGSATKGAANPFFKSKYADLGAVMEVVKDPLNEEGISILQPVSSRDGAHYVETLLLHESGEYIASNPMKLELKEHTMQALGSAITYSRRYTLQSLLSIPAEDDDGEATMTRGKKEKPSLAVVPAPAPTVAAGPTSTITTALQNQVIAAIATPAATPPEKSFTTFRGRKPLESKVEGTNNIPLSASSNNGGW